MVRQIPSPAFGRFDRRCRRSRRPGRRQWRGQIDVDKSARGLYPDAEYSGSLQGERLDLSSPVSALEAGIGVVHQEIDLAPNFTVAENMMLGREPTASYPFGIRLIRRRQLVEQARKSCMKWVLEALRAEDLVARLPIETRQIAQVARILALDAKVVVFDEPTARPERRGPLSAFRGNRRPAPRRQNGRVRVHYLEEISASQIGSWSCVTGVWRAIAKPGISTFPA